jgi:hypothetical protein
VSHRDHVGPVLNAGRAADAVVAAIRALNRDVEIVDRGAYVRVLVPWKCVVTRAAIEEHTRAPFVLPSDLEAIMPSFKGHLSMNAREAAWELRARREETR